MADTLTREKRSELMRRVRRENTEPEMVVRRAAHALGFRFRLHPRDLPGKPDLVFPGRRKIVFVHGCFWHGHVCRRGALPKSRTDYWFARIERNRSRDAENQVALAALGWRVLVVWECETRDHDALRRLLSGFLADDK